MRLFDTSFLINLVNNQTGAVEKARQADKEDDPAAISAITVHEYLLGVHLEYYESKRLGGEARQCEKRPSRLPSNPANLRDCRGEFEDPSASRTQRQTDSHERPLYRIHSPETQDTTRD